MWRQRNNLLLWNKEPLPQETQTGKIHVKAHPDFLDCNAIQTQAWRPNSQSIGSSWELVGCCPGLSCWSCLNLFSKKCFRLLLERSDVELSYAMTGKHLQSSTEVRDTPWRKTFMLCANLWAPIHLPLQLLCLLPWDTTNPGCPWLHHFPSSAGLSSLAQNSGINLTVFP